WGVRALAQVCHDLDCTLVHFSSDYVFGLEEGRGRPYAEADAPGPVNVYGLSKLAGDYLVRALCPRHFVIRTCGLYGVWGSGGRGTACWTGRLTRNWACRRCGRGGLRWRRTWRSGGGNSGPRADHFNLGDPASFTRPLKRLV